jgi:hypothetical protein
MVKRSTLEKHFTVVAEEFRIRLGQLVWQANWFPFKWNKVLFKGGLWEKTTESLAQDDVQTLVKRDKTGIKRSIVQCRKAKAIPWIQPFVWKFTPRLDVARNQQSWNVDAADAATDIVGIQNCLPEELLSAPHFYCREELGIFPSTRGIVISNLTATTICNARVRAIGGSTQYSQWGATVPAVVN